MLFCIVLLEVHRPLRMGVCIPMERFKSPKVFKPSLSNYIAHNWTLNELLEVGPLKSSKGGLKVIFTDLSSYRSIGLCQNSWKGLVKVTFTSYLQKSKWPQ